MIEIPAHLREPKTLRQKQSLFAFLIAHLILRAYDLGCEVTCSDFHAWEKDGRHMRGSVHYLKLAADLNLFKGGKWLTMTEDHAELGAYWKGLHPLCRWGGDFRDGNDYSITHGGKA